MSAEQIQLQATITALESQRAVLGDAVVDMAVAPLRAKLAALTAVAAAPEVALQTLKQVTILFLDIVGSTALSQHLDPEEIHEVMDGALSRCTSIVQAHAGKVLQYAGDNLLAVFGADESREDDPERAVRCGLALLAQGLVLGHEVAQAHGHAGFNVRVGLHTGGVLLGGGVDAEGSIRGIAVNIAARMEQTAPAGALRISQDTFHHVRGLFEFEVQPPIAVKGVDEPITTYLVSRAKPRAFHGATRGIDGADSRMIGRDAELAILKDAHQRLLHARQLSVVSIVADAGVGKSRLLLEYTQWSAAQSARFITVQGRAEPRTQSQPFGLLRDLFGRWVQIADGDNLQAAKDKFEQFIAPLFDDEDGPDLAQSHAHLLGHLIGLNFSDSRHVKGLHDDPKQVRSRAFHTAAQVFRRVQVRHQQPIVLELDDLHWSDDGSLDFLFYLARVNRDVPMLVVVLTRHTLFERRSDWSAFDSLQQRIHLQPLDKGSSHLLASELLKKLPDIPAELSELIIGRSEGNPFYMEELVKMLVDHGAIETGPERWILHSERLLATPVPSTLTGVLQARLDGLPAAERLALQEASVIGLVFWDQALAALDAKAPLALPALVQRVLAVPSQDASMDGVREYSFGHQIMHDVTYETLLKRTRRELHARAAAWLSGLIGARASDFLGATAEHYEKAGDHPQACEYFARAAEQARSRFAHEAALAYVTRALALLGAADGPASQLLRWRLLDARERTLELQGRRPEQRIDLDALQAVADALDDDHRRAELATRRSMLALRGGDYASQASAAQDALMLATRAHDDERRLNAQRLLADAYTRQGDAAAGRALVNEGLAEARALGLRGLESRFLNALTVIAGHQQDLVAMLETSQQATLIRRELGDRRNEAIGLATIGGAWLELGEFDQAATHLREALKLHRAVGDRALEPIALANLSQLTLCQGDATTAREHAQAAHDIAHAVQAKDLLALALWSLGNAELALQNLAQADAAFEQAHAVASSIHSASVHDATAGRARVALAQGDTPTALRHVEVLMAHLAAGGTLDGTIGLRQIQLTCQQALTAAGDARAHDMLARAHAHMQAEVATISDARLQQTFLNQVPENRAILAAWQARPGAAGAGSG